MGVTFTVPTMSTRYSEAPYGRKGVLDRWTSIHCKYGNTVEYNAMITRYSEAPDGSKGALNSWTSTHL